MSTLTSYKYDKQHKKTPLTVVTVDFTLSSCDKQYKLKRNFKHIYLLYQWTVHIDTLTPLPVVLVDCANWQTTNFTCCTSGLYKLTHYHLYLLYWWTVHIDTLPPLPVVPVDCTNWHTTTFTCCTGGLYTLTHYHLYLLYLWTVHTDSRAPKKNTSHGNQVLPQDTTYLIQRPCYQCGNPRQDQAGNWTTQRPPDHHKEMQTAVVWSCLPFIRPGQNHLARHSEWGEEDKADRGRGGKTTSGNGQAWSSPSPRGQWRTGKNGGNWLWNYVWCPNDPCG